MDLKKQDKNGMRQASEVPRRYKQLGQIKTIIKQVKTLENKDDIEVDKSLSETSSNPVQNKAIKQALDNLDNKLDEISNKIEDIDTIKEMNIEDSQGYVWFVSGLLIQWGLALLEETSIEILFPYSYDNIPFIEAVPYSDTMIQFAINGLEDPKTGLVIYCDELNSFGWKAIGYKKYSREEESQ